MAYGEQAVQRRRCTATRRDGQPCRAWALWGAEGQRCAAHTYSTRRTLTPLQRAYLGRQPTQAEPCRCAAYPWPHRPGGGLCRWPEAPLVRAVYPPGDRHALPPAARRKR